MLLLAAALCLLDPTLVTDWIGMALAALAILIYKYGKGKRNV